MEKLEKYFNVSIKIFAEEIAPNIFVLNYRNDQIAQSFIDDYNTNILMQWLKGKEKVYPYTANVIDLIGNIVN
jgi:hypothetical protein